MLSICGKAVLRDPDSVMVRRRSYLGVVSRLLVASIASKGEVDIWCSGEDEGYLLMKSSKNGVKQAKMKRKGDVINEGRWMMEDGG